MALGAYQAAYSRGIRIPQDLAVVGFDGIPEAGYFWPPLSTVWQDQNLMGSIAVERIVAMIESLLQDETPLEPETTILTPELIIRESSLYPNKAIL
jgi:DNA-binding LacI/PurR family transcriptional regulator